MKLNTTTSAKLSTSNPKQLEFKTPALIGVCDSNVLKSQQEERKYKAVCNG